MAAEFEMELKFGASADDATLNGSAGRFVFDTLRFGGGGGLLVRPWDRFSGGPVRGACCKMKIQFKIMIPPRVTYVRHRLFTSFSLTAADLASIGGRGGATVGRLIVGAGRMLTELIASCDWNAAGTPRMVPNCCGNAEPATEIGGDLKPSSKQKKQKKKIEKKKQFKISFFRTKFFNLQVSQRR